MFFRILCTSVCVSGGLYASRWTGIMGQRRPCVSGTSNWSKGGYIHWCVITSKYQTRLASKLDKSLGSHKFGPDQITERWEGLQVGYWRDQEVQVNYWRGYWVNWETYLHVCVHGRGNWRQEDPSACYWVDRASGYRELLEGTCLCVCTHASWPFFQELECGCNPQWFICQVASNWGERGYRDRLNV